MMLFFLPSFFRSLLEGVYSGVVSYSSLLSSFVTYILHCFLFCKCQYDYRFPHLHIHLLKTKTTLYKNQNYDKLYKIVLYHIQSMAINLIQYQKQLQPKL